MRTLAAMAVPALLCAMGQDPAPGARRVVVVAHRGAHEAAPENTLPAFRAAVAMGCDSVEMDVRRTRDGALVLMHDRTVDRTTNGTGAVADLTLAQIRVLDAGAHGGAENAGTRVPTFDEALAVCRRKVRVYVDDKTDSQDEVLAAIARRGMLQQVVIYGSERQLGTVRRMRPRVWIMPDHPDTDAGFTDLARTLHPETVDGNLRDWTREQAAAAHRLGMQVWVDNLGENDDEAGYRKALQLGVDAIQTDHPARLLAFLTQVGRR